MVVKRRKRSRRKKLSMKRIWTVGVAAGASLRYWPIEGGKFISIAGCLQR